MGNSSSHTQINSLIHIILLCFANDEFASQQIPRNVIVWVWRNGSTRTVEQILFVDLFDCRR